MKDYEFHPLNSALPMIPDVELAQMALSIKQNGLRVPIILYEGKILDGKIRYICCRMVNVEPTFDDFHGSLEEAADLLTSLNCFNQCYTPEQRDKIEASFRDYQERDLDLKDHRN